MLLVMHVFGQIDFRRRSDALDAAAIDRP